MVVGNRIPKDYFITKGTGESDIAIHAGSYHLALKAAGIEMANIMT
ncbi:MAG: arginine decarboxylase, partial [Bacteroidales bacterium]|nr:arginine decarboxylase [Bacteroidales bacterium]